MSLRKNRKHNPSKLPFRRLPEKCWACRKLSFASRKEARRQAALLPKESDGYRARAYQCPVSGAWHVGHLPEDVIKGEVSRQKVRESMRERDERRGEVSEQVVRRSGGVNPGGDDLSGLLCVAARDAIPWRRRASRCGIPDDSADDFGSEGGDR